MKKIYKKIKQIGNFYKTYQLRVTPDIIEVKFTPKKDNENEVVFMQQTEISVNFRNTSFLVDLEHHFKKISE